MAQRRVGAMDEGGNADSCPAGFKPSQTKIAKEVQGVGPSLLLHHLIKEFVGEEERVGMVVRWGVEGGGGEKAGRRGKGVGRAIANWPIVQREYFCWALTAAQFELP